MAQESKNDQLNNIARAIPTFGMLYLMSAAEDRDEAFVTELRNDAKRTFPEHAPTIDALQEMLERVDTSRKLYTRLYPGRIERLTGAAFARTRVSKAPELLATILWARSINSDQGWVNSDLLVRELEQMETELGSDKFQSPDLSFDDVLAAILSRDLKLKRKTPNQ